MGCRGEAGGTGPAAQTACAVPGERTAAGAGGACVARGLPGPERLDKEVLRFPAAARGVRGVCSGPREEQPSQTGRDH